MVRVMAVDDEAAVPEALRALFGSGPLGSDWALVRWAKTGQEAVEAALELVPDILVVEPRLPGISGLDVLRALRGRGLDPAVVVASAVERFEAARDAADLGVAAYLTKPVRRDDLAAALRRARARQENAAALRDAELRGKDGEARLRSLAEDSFLRAVLLGEALAPRAREWRGLLGRTEGLVRVIAAAFFSLDGQDSTAEAYERFRALLRNATPFPAGPLAEGRSAAVQFAASGTRGEAELAAFRKLAEERLKADLEAGVTKLGFGSLGPWERADLSRREALDALHSRGGPAAPREPGLLALEHSLDQAFIDELLASNIHRAELHLVRLLDALAEAPDGDALRYRSLSLLVNACRIMIKRGYLRPEDAAELLELRAVHDLPDARQFRQAVLQRFRDIKASLRPRRGSSPAVLRCLALIQERYGDALSLRDAADQAGLTPGRLSKLLVLETGKGFSEHLIRHRIGRAKELLAQPGSSVKSVSARCGYADPNYFARLFRKATGLTPTAFAEGRR